MDSPRSRRNNRMSSTQSVDSADSSAFLIERALRGEPLTREEMQQQEQILQQASQRKLNIDAGAGHDDTVSALDNGGGGGGISNGHSNGHGNTHRQEQHRGDHRHSDQQVSGMTNSGNDDTSFTGGSEGGNSASTTDQNDFAKKETQWINCSKVLVAIVLLCAAGLTGRYTYRLTSREEKEDFESQVSFIFMSYDRLWMSYLSVN